MKKRIFIDQDGVLANFYSAAKQALIDNPKQRFPQSQWGFFLKLKPLPDAIESYKMLSDMYDVRILTRASARNVNCYTEKAQWVWDHLGFEALDKMIFSGDKSIVEGDYLIDDQNNAKQDQFKGKLIVFGSKEFPDWKAVMNYFADKI